METLDHKVLKDIGYKGYIKEKAPVRMMQFGEGNFMRAFVDYWFDLCNERGAWDGKVCLVQPIAQGLSKLINAQEGLYTLYLRGSDNGMKVNEKRIISDVAECLNPYEKADYDRMMEIAASDELEFMASNTTEAGIAYDAACSFDDCPPSGYPAKLTQVLYRRYKAGKKGIVMLSCELIDNNGRELKKCVEQYIEQWGLEADFRKWIDEENIFCSTLVDRIVPGRIRDPKEAARLEEENGYHDELLDVGECFGAWVIEGPERLNDMLPFKKAGIDNIMIVPDVTPYKKRKVRILNGAHTGFVLGAYLAGFDIVRDCMHDVTVHDFMNKMLNEEVIPTLPLDRKDLDAFAAAVQDRFNNPFVDHQLISISLNSTSKWKARNMPSFLDYIDKQGRLPVCLTMSLAAYIAFYSNDIRELGEKGLVCRRPKGDSYTVMDDGWVLKFFYDRKGADEESLVRDVLADKDMWDRDLNKISGLTEQVTKDLKMIRRDGAEAAFRSCL